MPRSRSSPAARRSTCGSSSNRTSSTRSPATLFPADLLLPADGVSGAYMPTFLPGTRLLPGFFKGPHRNVETYPSRWAFADYLSADVGKGHVARVLGEPGAENHRTGRYRLRAPRRGRRLWWPVCLRDARLPDVGGTRTEVDEPTGQGSRRRHRGAVARRLPRRQRHRRLSVARREGRLQARQARPRAADQGRSLEGAARVQGQWPQHLQQLPSPALVHPVAFQSGGFDEAHPDFLPPDPRWGESADFNIMATAPGRSGSSSCRT